jgi:hypothetical protein
MPDPERKPSALPLRRVQFTVRRIMIAVAILAIILGVLCWAFREAPVFVVAATPPSRVNADHDVFDIVLADLIENPDFNQSIRAPGPRSTQIVMHSQTRGYVTRAFLEMYRWPRENGAPEDALDDLVARNPKGTEFTLDSYQPSNAKIVVANLGESQREYWSPPGFPGSCGYIVPFLPGYSRDGKTAIFLFRLPPLGYHPGWGCYLLDKKDGRWIIANKQLFHWL